MIEGEARAADFVRQFGRRASVKVRFQDHPHSAGTDYDPHERETFLSKLLRRRARQNQGKGEQMIENGERPMQGMPDPDFREVGEAPGAARYGLLVEWKAEGPLIMEGSPMTLDAAWEKLRQFEGSPRVIRVAIVRVEYEAGNETLLPRREATR